MKMKRLLAAGCASVMALSMITPALAAEDDTAPAVNDSTSLTQSTAITGRMESPTIKVTVPNTGSVALNPYKIGVTLGEQENVTDQILSAAQFIENRSNVALDVNVSVTSTPAGKVKLSATSTASTEPTATAANNVFLYFEMVNTNDGETIPTWAGAYDENKHVLANGTGSKAVKKDGIVTLAAGVDGDIAATDGCAAFHLAGDMQSAPDTKTAWTSTDKVDVTIAFTFAPVVPTTATESD